MKSVKMFILLENLSNQTIQHIILDNLLAFE